MKNSILLIFSALFLLTACNPDDELPTVEEPRFPYFTMQVDGILWAPSGASIGGGAPFSVTYRPDLEGFISLSALSIGHNLSNINMSSKNIIPFGQININRNCKLRNSKFESNCILFGLDSLMSNYIEIEELDVNSQTIKVKFEFDAINECGDVIQIRNGEQHNYYGS